MSDPRFGNIQARSCGCIGPQNGEPLCPCMMRAKGVYRRDGRWIEPERDLGPAWDADVNPHTVAQIRAERGIDASQPNWQELFAKAFAAYDAMTPEQKAAHDAAQKASFIKGMGPCEHGVYDFETCPDCRGTPP